MTPHHMHKSLDMNALLFSTAKRYFSVPEKLHILAELAEGPLTDAQAIDKYQLSPKLLRAWRKWRHQYILKKYKPRTMDGEGGDYQRKASSTDSCLPAPSIPEPCNR
jgi:hypothetical protein